MSQDEIVIKIRQLKVWISPQKAIKTKNENNVVEGVKQGIHPASPAKEIKSLHFIIHGTNFPSFWQRSNKFESKSSPRASKTNRIPVIIKKGTNLADG
ncbi:MAG: hypothetical protein KHX57_10640 [Streptococcus sp.]|nr:hypothetical protein [Streptococcus sp.]